MGDLEKACRNERLEASERFRIALLDLLRAAPLGRQLREASLAGRLKDWTGLLTEAAALSAKAIGWRASAKKHPMELLPVSRSEYLVLDVMAFEEGEKRWLFPVAVMELENSPREDQIAYSLWKVLCINASLRIVFCYRKQPQDVPGLIRHLRLEVVEAMALDGRVALEGETIVVVGSRNEADTFPDGFFSWWRLDKNTGVFERF